MKDTDTTVMMTITVTGISARNGTIGVTGMLGGMEIGGGRSTIIAMKDMGMMMINSWGDESQ